ncbi:FkbM family methyltransferase [Streptomyces sp. NBC_00237]|uniref:FkbM family methyltransferase n=1 Tax=Streptomyces sp. NBC_00237 TaxID=2975687 RepID=UPI00224D6B38|nr:FkbM family methyltransferase [Streptomyces sp. NBC_00237]MCX5207305.1 FkbM family methyltransferase [Streptomyces sp. NBC_00237]
MPSAVPPPVSELMVTLGRGYVRNAPGSWFKGPLAAGYLNAHLRARPRQRVVEARFDARFAVDTRDLIQRYIHLFGVWEPHMTSWLQSRLGPGDVLVDVGANVGYFTVLGSRLVGSTGRVVAIEASPVFHRRVLQHIELNGCENVRAVNGAVSDSTKTLTFVLASSNNMGANSIVPYDGPAESTFAMEAHPLPALLEPDELARARVIKIDVEGAEGSVIRGLAPALGQLREDVEIAVEVTPERMAKLGDSVEELLETMHGHGFHTYRLPSDYRPGSYPPAMSRPTPPTRWRESIAGETELVFSRIDAEVLAQ